MLSLDPESYSLNIQLFNMYWVLFSNFIWTLSSSWISECHGFVVVDRVQYSSVSFSVLGGVALYESYYYFRDYPMLIMLPERRCDWRRSTSTWTSLEVGCGGQEQLRWKVTFWDMTCFSTSLFALCRSDSHLGMHSRCQRLDAHKQAEAKCQ